VVPTQTNPAVASEVRREGLAPNPDRTIPLYAVLAVLAFCAFWILLGSLVVPGARQHDFLSFYTGASLARDGTFKYGTFKDMYAPDVQLERQREYAQLPDLVPYIRPPFYALFLTPLAWLPFGAAFWAWLGIQTAVLLGAWAWAFRRWGTDALIFGSMYLPTALGIAHAQDCVLMLAIVGGVYWLARREKHFLSGVILGAGLIKFHLFLLWPLAVLIQRRWRMLAGACAAALVELLVSLLLVGPSGLMQYAALLRMPDLRQLNPSPELMINVRSLALNLGMDNLMVTGMLTAVVAILTVAACWRAPLWRVVAAASAGSLLVAPHVYGYDAALLLAGLWLAMFEPGGTRGARITATVLLTPVPLLLGLAGSPWAAATPLALLAFLISLAWMIPWVSRETVLATTA